MTEKRFDEIVGKISMLIILIAVGIYLAITLVNNIPSTQTDECNQECKIDYIYTIYKGTNPDFEVEEVDITP